MGRYESSQASYYTDLDDERSVIGLFDMFNDRRSRYGSQDVTLAFRRTGTQITTFSTELRFSRNDNSDNSNLFGDLHQSDASTPTSIPTEHDRSVSGYPSWNLQSDISHPFGANSKIEAGFKGTQRSTSIDFTAAYLDPNTDEYVPNAQRANAFDYTERIGAAYTVLSQQVGKVQGQAGLRLEQASTHLDLPLVGLNLNNNYASAFPSAIVSYNFTDMRQAKLSYSRRISRPNPWQLSPVEYRQDSRNVFHGNPDLRAEYTDALELGLQESRAWGSVQVNPYVRHTLHAVRYIQTVDTAGVSLGTYANLASTLTWGTDFNVTVRAGALTLLTGGSAWRYTSDASNLSGNLSARAFVWSSRANLTWKFSPVTDAQLSGNYRAPYNTEGGSQASTIFMNISGRYKAWGDAGSISVRVADPFNMFKYGYRTLTGSVEEISVRQFQQRALYISINRTFGQQVKLRPKSDGDSQPQQGAGVP
jgi:outer membrane receptor protein involved in Fe transport